jgi:6-phosphogluconolactonase
MTSQTVLVGTYTEKLPFVDGKAEGIYVYSLNEATGELTHLSTGVGPRNPSYLAIDPSNSNVYAVQETEVNDSPAVHALSLNNNSLLPINEQPAHGGLPCHIIVDATGKYVLSANYETGSIAVYPIRKDGGLDSATTIIQHKGPVTNKKLPLGPHAHAVVLNEANDRLFVPDLGFDRVLMYSFDSLTGSLTPSDPPFVQLHLGAGPRHFIFDPQERYAFALGETDATITVFSHRDGMLNPLQNISALPDTEIPGNSAAEIAITFDGRFVYSSNRGHDSIACFRFSDGELIPTGHTSSQGRSPRDFAIDLTGAFLIVGNQDTDNVVTFRIDQTTGTLEPTGHVISVPNPVCILPVNL